MFLKIKYIKKLRINQQIQVPEVMLIFDDGKKALLTSQKAFEIAQQQNLDLVEVSPLSKPPVCKIMDFGQYLYKQKKNEKKQKKLSKKKELKKIRLSVRIDTHDLEIKAKQSIKFLTAGNAVKVTLMFRGREMQHMELGFDKMKKFIEMIGEVGKAEKNPQRQGNQIFVMLIPQVVKTK